MKTLQKTLFLIAMLVLSTQAIRHVYVKFFENTASVLDEFSKDDTREQIKVAVSLDELLVKYRPARQREEELDAQLKELEKQKPEEQRDEFRTEYRTEHQEDYDKAYDLQAAIQDWEAKSMEIRELRLFWAAGLILVLLGGCLYPKAPWVGLALVIPGVTEMIWWTSPSFSLGGAVLEYERLLNNKLFFTGITLVLVPVLWCLASRLENKDSQSAGR